MSETPARTASGVDFSRVSRGAWISAVGAFVLLISVFFNWYSGTVSISGGSIPGLSGSVSKSVSGTSATDVAWIVFLLALIALAAWVVELFVEGVNMPYPAWMVAGGAGALAILLVLFRIVSKPGGLGTSTGGSIDLGSGSKLSWSVSTSFGIWLALLAAIAVVVGAYMVMNEPTTSIERGAPEAAPPPPPPPPPPAPEPPESSSTV
jgi:hypothetical protein